MCRGRRTRILLHLHILREMRVLRGSRAGWHFGCRNHPSCVHVLGRRTRTGGRRVRILLHLHIQREKIVLREKAELVGVLVAETIHPACMCELFV
jgi:hypothetical protein